MRKEEWRLIRSWSSSGSSLLVFPSGFELLIDAGDDGGVCWED